MPSVEPFDSTVEEKLSAGSALFELCADEDVALADAWDGDGAPLKVQPGRVGVESAAANHTPVIHLASYTAEPEPVGDDYTLVGHVEVEWNSDHVELWTSDSDVGRARQLRLPPSPTGRYLLRASRSFSPKVSGTLSDYLNEHPNKTKGLELWRFEFWPAS